MWFRVCASAVLLMLAGSSLGNAAGSLLRSVYPAGGRVGSEIEVEVCGSDLAGPYQAVISGVGVKATFLGKKQVRQLNKKGRPVSVPVSDRFRFRVVVEKDAEPGIRMFRLAYAQELSEPLGFEIADLPEQEATVKSGGAMDPCRVAEMPVCLNGRVQTEEGDRYAFAANRGTVLVAKAVPEVLPFNGFVPELMFCDARGNPCDSVTRYGAAGAPVSVFQVPQDGEYVLKVTARAGKPGDICVYRVRLGELPVITSFSPVSAVKGESLNVRLTGYNLARERVRLFTGGKNSQMCLDTITEGAYVLPSLGFELRESGAEAELLPQPEFMAYMTPASLNIPANGSALVTVRVRRLNGFDGDVRVQLDYPPLGIACEGGFVPAGQDTCRMTVSTDGHRYPKTLFELALTAEGEMDGAKLRRPVIPVRHAGGEDAETFREFAGLAVRVNAQTRSLRIETAASRPVSLTLGQAVPLKLSSPVFSAQSGSLYQPVAVWPATGFSVEGMQQANRKESASVLLTADPRVMRSGEKGFFILGLVKRGDAGGEILSVSQSVPYVVTE
ncbi:MAG: hypothetical protein PHU80_00395 [Kiritimatiellae bacterium]|nr:hypothetical protein [Kiritimatiellia bacterium]